MVALTRSSLPWVPHTWMSGTNPLQTPRALFCGTHMWAISAALLGGGLSRTVGNVLVFGPPLSWYASVFFCVCRSVCMSFSVCVCVCVCVCVRYTIYGYGSRCDVYDAMKWFFPIMCMYISCVGVYMYSWIQCRVDLSVFLRRFNVLCYASGFYMLLFLRHMFMMHACMCVCVCVCVCVCGCCCCCCLLLLFIGIVQRNWACLTWKSAIEIKSLLLLSTGALTGGLYASPLDSA